MEAYELASRILPCPKQLKLLQGGGLLLDKDSRFFLQPENICDPVVESVG